MVPFQSTVWAEIDRARERDPEAYLNFVNKYRPALVSFLRAQGVPKDDTEDLAQEVFLYILRGKVLAKVDPKKGKFRNLILAVTRNVILNEQRRRNAVKRGRGHTTISLDQAELSVSGPDVEDKTFDEMWARQLVALALKELSVANPHYYRALRLMLNGESYKEIARAMSKSATEVNNYIHRAKAWVARTVRRLIAEYCANDSDYRDELQHLSRYLSNDRPV